ncbi:MAG: HAD family hydrolase [Treponemataceae bacterium]|nr:HAD family hydrolase [Spirochaetales bacterium]MDY6031253.1 HAD family hydrolase [Treponemataceae bacterium]
MKLDFSTIEAVIFDLDGTIYELNDFQTKLKLSFPFNTKKIKAEQTVRTELENNDFEDSQRFYSVFFERCAQKSLSKIDRFLIKFLSKRGNIKAEQTMVKNKIDAYRIWYFTKYLPKICKLIKDYYPKREEFDNLLVQFTRTETPFIVFSDYTFAEEKLEAAGLCDKEKIMVFSAEDMGCLKPSSRAYKTIENSILFKNYGSSNILMVSTKDIDKEGAKKAGFTFLKIIDNEDETKENFDKNCYAMTWKDFASQLDLHLRQKAIKYTH